MGCMQALESVQVRSCLLRRVEQVCITCELHHMQCWALHSGEIIPAFDRNFHISKLIFAFRIIVFYPLNAILTIIGNVLLGPLQAKVEQDMKLLESTADLIKQIWTQRSIHIDHSDLVRVESFVSEVIRLGRSTIVAAGKGQNGLDHIGTEMLCGSV